MTGQRRSSDSYAWRPDAATRQRARLTAFMARHGIDTFEDLHARSVAEDFAARYGERPVLLETFVEIPRFRATCYRAANWRYLGETQGRGKCDVAHRAADEYPVHSEACALHSRYRPSANHPPG